MHVTENGFWSLLTAKNFELARSSYKRNPTFWTLLLRSAGDRFTYWKSSLDRLRIQPAHFSTVDLGLVGRSGTRLGDISEDCIRKASGKLPLPGINHYEVSGILMGFST